MTKICTKCNRNKPISQFYSRGLNRNDTQVYCKDCFTDYCTQRWINRKLEAIKYKGDQCQRCKLHVKDTHYCVFDFHHRDPKKKEFTWVKMRLMSLDKMKKELDKCDLLCSNCHRIIHMTN